MKGKRAHGRTLACSPAGTHGHLDKKDSGNGEYSRFASAAETPFIGSLDFLGRQGLRIELHFIDPAVKEASLVFAASEIERTPSGLESRGFCHRHLAGRMTVHEQRHPLTL